MNLKNKIVLTQYSIAHALVDMVCIAGVYTMFNSFRMTVGEFLPYILLYNFIAFALQAPVGLLVDYIAKPKQSAVASLMILILAVFLMNFSMLLSVVLFGFANALYHVAGGSVCFNLAPFKAAAPGIFVGPGAFGLVMGGVIGRSDTMNQAGFAFLLLVMSFIIWKTEIDKVDIVIDDNISKQKKIYLAFILIFIVVACRALIGTVIKMPWQSSLTLLFVSTIFVSLGKGFGGVIADRMGWMKTGLFGLIVSAPLLLFFSTVPIFGILGNFIFQFTMAITLVATYKIFPTRPAFAFGLPCLALFLGTLPALLGKNALFMNFDLKVSMFVIAALSLYFGLRIIFGKGSIEGNN